MGLRSKKLILTVLEYANDNDSNFLYFADGFLIGY